MIYLVILAGTILRLINLNQSLWLDEAAQAIESSRPIWQQFNLAADFHPPLYHLLLHFWLYLGKSEIWIRLPSILIGLGSIILIYKLGIILSKKNEALIAALFLSVSPYHLWYSQEARPYMLFVLTSLLSSYFLLQKKWLRYTISLILVLYSSYFSIFLIFSHIFYIYLFQRHKWHSFIRSISLGLISFLPWIPSIIQQLSVGTSGFFTGWTSVVSISPLKSVPLTFAKFTFGHGSINNHLVYTMVILPALIIFGISIFKILKIRKGQILIILFFLPFLSASIVSFFIPILAPQRLIFLLPIFYLIISVGIQQMKKTWKLLAITIVFIISLAGIYQYYTNRYVQRENWRSAVSFIEEKSDKNSLALFVFPEPFAPYLWYKKDKIEAIGISPKFILQDEDLNRMLPRLTNKKRIYLFQYLTGLTDPQERARKFITMIGYQESLIKDFPGVGFIYIFDKKIGLNQI